MSEGAGRELRDALVVCLDERAPYNLIIVWNVVLRNEVPTSMQSMQCQTNDDIELDVIEPPVVPSQLEFIETAEPEVVIVQISSSHCVQEKQAGPSHHLAGCCSN